MQQKGKEKIDNFFSKLEKDPATKNAVDEFNKKLNEALPFLGDKVIDKITGTTGIDRVNYYNKIKQIGDDSLERDLTNRAIAAEVGIKELRQAFIARIYNEKNLGEIDTSQLLILMKMIDVNARTEIEYLKAQDKAEEELDKMRAETAQMQALADKMRAEARQQSAQASLDEAKADNAIKGFSRL